MSGTPDLQSILATLARYSNNSTAPSTTPPASANTWIPNAATHAPPPIISHGSNDRSRDPRLAKAAETPAVAAPPPKPIDPSTITTWSEGLRCVTKIAAHNSQFVPTIKRMMQDQKSHEMRWYSERQTLKQSQINRATSSAKATSILQALNPGFVASQQQPSGQSEADKAAELAAFDRKIYAAQVAMDSVMSAELKGLGVPFFGTNSDLIRSEDGDVAEGNQLDELPKWSMVITDSQLLDLRRRMIGHLEDLYRD